MIKIHTVLVSPFLQNCNIIACTETKEATIIDPGYDPKKIIQVINDNGYKVVSYLITHAHADHVSSVTALEKVFPAPVYMNPKEKPILKLLPIWQKKYRFDEGTIPKNWKPITDKDKFICGKLSILAIETPGHTPGSTCFLVDGKLFTGDTLFEKNIGRSSFDFGDHDLLLKSIKENLYTLDGNTEIYPGHGANSTIKSERENNPYCHLP